MDRLAHSNLIETHWEERPSHGSDEAEAVPTPGENGPTGPVTMERGMRRRSKLWAVGGGKGGVGKSLIAANFAISLARRGRNVLVVDLDIGGANLHTCLGLAPPPVGIGDWAAGRVQDLREVMVSTGEARLRMISGAPDPLKIIGLIEKRREALLQALLALDFDDVILDLGAGTADLTIDFFVAADQGIISILPEPTSVENAYRFIRAALFRKLRNAEVSEGIREVIDAAMDQKNVLGIRTPADLLAIVERLDSAAGARLRETILLLSPSIVINQVRSQVDTDVGRAICSVCRRYFGLNVRYAGYLDYDNAVWKAVRQKKSVLNEYPHSILANRLEHLTRTLLGEEEGIA